jgi:hypothetical protein
LTSSPVILFEETTIKGYNTILRLLRKGGLIMCFKIHYKVLVKQLLRISEEKNRSNGILLFPEKEAKSVVLLCRNLTFTPNLGDTEIGYLGNSAGFKYMQGNKKNVEKGTNGRIRHK